MATIYIVEYDKGTWDDWEWDIHSIWDCPVKADEAKRLFLAKIEEMKASENSLWRRFGNRINQVSVTEYELNSVNKRKLTP